MYNVIHKTKEFWYSGFSIPGTVFTNILLVISLNPYGAQQFSSSLLPMEIIQLFINILEIGH